jgi:hypothetical protein
MNDLFKEKSDEEYRPQCEVRQHLKWRAEKGIDWYRKYISTYGFGGRKTKLLRDVAEQWANGNRGKGEWK